MDKWFGETQQGTARGLQCLKREGFVAQSPLKHWYCCRSESSQPEGTTFNLQLQDMKRDLSLLALCGEMY